MKISNNHKVKFTLKNSLLLALGVLLLAAFTTALYLHMNSDDSEPIATQTVMMSTLHPTYASLDDMIADPDASFVGIGTVLDNGKMASRSVSRDPGVPPEITTDHEIRVTSVIKGDNISRTVTIAMLGGIADDTHYFYPDVPKIKKGDVVLVFALRGDSDGKYYPLAGSTAVSVQKEDGTFSFTDTTMNTGSITFSEEKVRQSNR